MQWNEAIRGFRMYLRLEKSMSGNTIEAYLHDIEKFYQFAEINLTLKQPEHILPADISSFVEWLNGFGVSARSQSRILSGIRAFYKYLLLENKVEDNPTELIDFPKLGLKLPNVLSENEIEKLLSAIDLSLPEGHRNKAIIEIMYGCGLRVSELVNMNISNLFITEGFVKVIGKGDKERLVPIGSYSVKAIESRDPSTYGHSYRVAEYTIALAKSLDQAGQGPYKNVSFTQEQLKEIRYASLLHDFGKVGVREEVLIKAKKLYPTQIEIIKNRFDYLIQSLQWQLVQQKYDRLKAGNSDADWDSTMDTELASRITELKDFFQTIILANEPTLLEEKSEFNLDKIKEITYLNADHNYKNLLEEDEYNKLRIKKGSLDEAERIMIESHVTHTFQFLSTIPWTKEMSQIPAIAYGHHEKLNGSGYPRHISSVGIPLQSKMMTIADIYDALTARDRPYKKAVPIDKALQILQSEVRSNNIDAELLKIFIDAKIYYQKDNLMNKE